MLPEWWNTESKIQNDSLLFVKLWCCEPIWSLSVCFVESAQATHSPTNDNGSSTLASSQTESTIRVCQCSSIAPPATDTPKRSSPGLGLLTITWTVECVGNVTLNLSDPSSSSTPVCYNDTKSLILLRDVCQNKKGCQGTPSWNSSNSKQHCSYFTESGAVDMVHHNTLSVHCAGWSTVCVLLSVVVSENMI